MEKTINNYMGRDGFFWFMGVVEERDDPLKLGRVRIRILGLHSELRTANDQTGKGIKVDDLPWAMPVQPITSAAMNGIGSTPLGPVKGTWIMGFSRDGEACQDILYIGTIGGIPQEAAQNIGFNDPDMVYPKSDHIGEPDTNRLARNENIDKTIVQTKNDSREKGIATSGGSSWDEPVSPYAAVYPFNHVKESESGHVSEVDDTPDAERLHTYHVSGTYEEIGPDGSKTVKIVGDNYEIIAGNKNVYIKGTCNITIDGDANIYTKGNVNHKIDGDKEETIGGNFKQTVTGTIEITAGPNFKVTADRVDWN